MQISLSLSSPKPSLSIYYIDYIWLFATTWCITGTPVAVMCVCCGYNWNIWYVCMGCWSRWEWLRLMNSFFWISSLLVLKEMLVVLTLFWSWKCMFNRIENYIFLLGIIVQRQLLRFVQLFGNNFKIVEILIAAISFLLVVIEVHQIFIIMKESSIGLYILRRPGSCHTRHSAHKFNHIIPVILRINSHKITHFLWDEECLMNHKHKFAYG